MGYAGQLIYEIPVLPRVQIATILNNLPSTTLGSLPSTLSALLGASGLADQIEMIKITPAILGREELVWLWTAHLPAILFPATSAS